MMIICQLSTYYKLITDVANKRSTIVDARYSTGALLLLRIVYCINVIEFLLKIHDRNSVGQRKKLQGI